LGDDDDRLAAFRVEFVRSFGDKVILDDTVERLVARGRL
jgi:hypothetical protein